MDVFFLFFQIPWTFICKSAIETPTISLMVIVWLRTSSQWCRFQHRWEILFFRSYIEYFVKKYLKLKVSLHEVGLFVSMMLQRPMRCHRCCPLRWRHNGAVASQITSLKTVYSTIYSGAYKRKYQCSESLTFVRGIHRWPVNSPHKRPVTQKMFPFDNVIMHCLHYRL